MTDLRTAAQQALEALEFYKGCYGASPAEEAILTVLRAALAEPVPCNRSCAPGYCYCEPVQVPAQERNLCPRCCGKRSFPDSIHTCTPPVAECRACWGIGYDASGQRCACVEAV